MASKLISINLVLGLSMLAFGGALPELHFMDTVSGDNLGPINLNIKAGGMLRGSAQLKGGEEYVVKVKVDDAYSVLALFHDRFTDFNAYEAARDKGHDAVYWRGDNHGFAISHDNIHWDLLAPWESE